MQKLKALLILLTVIASLIPVYSCLAYLQKVIRPRASLARLLLYLLTALCIIFAATFLLVWIARQVFGPASP